MAAGEPGPEPFAIGEVVVGPGERRTIDLPIADLSTHTPMTMPVQVICGRRAGPRLFLCAALHGDEITGVEIIRRVLKLSALKRLRGTLVAVPIVNVLGFVSLSRYLPDRRDLNRSFPGIVSRQSELEITPDPGGAELVLLCTEPFAFEAKHADELAAEAPWAGRIDLRSAPVMAPQDYYDLLAPHSASLQIWETEYLHVLTGDNPVLDWLRGTALVPVLEALAGDELEAFLATCGKQLEEAYPQRPDGQTLFPFRRVFLLAVRP